MSEFSAETIFRDSIQFLVGLESMNGRIILVSTVLHGHIDKWKFGTSVSILSKTRRECRYFRELLGHL